MFGFNFIKVVKRFFIVMVIFFISLNCFSNLSPDVYTFLKIYSLSKKGIGGYDLKNLYSFSVYGNRDFVDLIVEFEHEGDLREYVLKRFPGNRFAVVRVPVDEVLNITNKSFVKYATVSKKLIPFLDVVREKLNLDYVYNYYGQDEVQGKNVIIGIIDTGIDASHDDFKNSSGSTRILYILDQTTNVYNPEWGYGVEYSKNDIDKNNSVSVDYDGHGTHVAGIAAGNGKLSNGKYMGISVASDIVVVKTDFSTGGILIGIEYVMKKAKSMGRPCVINLSLGLNIGSHDGKDMESLILGDLLNYYGREGNIIVVAGGNSGHSKIHYSNTVSLVPVSAVLSISNFGSVLGNVVCDFWIPKGKTFDIKVTSPDGYNFGWFSFSDNFQFQTYYSGTSLGIFMSSNVYNGDLNVQVLFMGNNSINGDWQIAFRTLGGNFLVHGWVDYSREVFAYFKNGDNYFSLNSLFLRDDVISVSAYVTKNSFLSVSGNVTFSMLTNDNISYFSSKGPTRDGRRKPDISAPGALVVAPLSSFSSYEGRYVDAKYRNYVAMMGTSMACPVVSGVCALLLSINPKFTSFDIIEYLKTYSEVSVYDQNGKFWDESWGWGKVNVRSIVESLRDPKNLVWFSGNVLRLDNGQNSTFLNFRLSEGNDTVKIDIYDINGNFVKTFGNVNLVTGLNKVHLVFDSWMKTGVYLVKIYGSKFNLTLKMVVIR